MELTADKLALPVPAISQMGERRYPNRRQAPLGRAEWAYAVFCAFHMRTMPVGWTTKLERFGL